MLLISGIINWNSGWIAKHTAIELLNSKKVYELGTVRSD